MLLKNMIKKELKNLNCVDIKIKENYNYFSGFFTSQKGKVYYLSSGDYRLKPKSFLIRTAKDYKDFSGGHNNYISILENDLDNLKENLFRFINNCEVVE